MTRDGPCLAKGKVKTDVHQRASSTCSVVLTVTTSLSQGGNLLMVLVRKDTMVSP